MALLGGGVGGAGNPVGGSFTGPAEALEIIGNHGYAYSGMKASSDTPTPYLSFTSGNYTFVGEMEPSYHTDSGDNVQFYLELNGSNIISVSLTSSINVFPNRTVIIPPYSQVEIFVDNLDGGTSSVGVSLTGRIYR